MSKQTSKRTLTGVRLGLSREEYKQFKIACLEDDSTVSGKLTKLILDYMESRRKKKE